MLNSLIKEIQAEANPEQAKILQRFFKTGQGEYGEGYIFLGIKVPVIRILAKKYNDLLLDDIQTLLASKIQEYQQIGLHILINKYEKAEDKKEIFEFYLINTKNINSWGLVDLSAPKIVGDFLLDKERNKLYELANSENLWEKRIAIVSTWRFIRENEFEDTLKISEILLNDSHDLIHKAVGWMLREVGKKDVEVLEKFLSEHYKKMPRTMLRYSIEKFDGEKRKKYLKGEI